MNKNNKEMLGNIVSRHKFVGKYEDIVYNIVKIIDMLDKGDDVAFEKTKFPFTKFGIKHSDNKITDESIINIRNALYDIIDKLREIKDENQINEKKIQEDVYKDYFDKSRYDYEKQQAEINRIANIKNNNLENVAKWAQKHCCMEEAKELLNLLGMFFVEDYEKFDLTKEELFYCWEGEKEEIIPAVVIAEDGKVKVIQKGTVIEKIGR